MSKNVNRRQFAKSVAAGAAAVAAGTVVAKTAQGCPFFFDDDGNRVVYWCIIFVDASNPVFWLYTYENCATGQTVDVVGAPGSSTGSCSSAASDDNCLDDGSFQKIDKEEIDGIELGFRSDISNVARAREFAKELIAARHES